MLGGTPFPVATGPANETSSSVSRNRIAYIGDGDVFRYDVASGMTTQITNDAATQRNVILDGQYLFWSDDRNGNFDVFVHELLGDRTYQLTSNASSQLLSDASGGRAVFNDDRFAAADVWVVDFAIPAANAPEPNAALLFGAALAILLLAFRPGARGRSRRPVRSRSMPGLRVA